MLSFGVWFWVLGAHTVEGQQNSAWKEKKMMAFTSLSVKEFGLGVWGQGYSIRIGEQCTVEVFMWFVGIVIVIAMSACS